MIQIDEATRNLLLNNTIHREIILRFPDDDFEITSDNIVSESFELTQSICDGKNFKLGGCVVGKMVINLIDVDTDLSGKRVNAFIRVTFSNNRLLPSNSLNPSASLIIGEQRQSAEYQLFSGKVNSIKRQKNRRIKKLTAYDAMYDFSEYIVSNLTITGMLQRRFQTDEVPLYVFTLAILQLAFDYEDIYNDATASFAKNKNIMFDEASIEQVAKNGISMVKIMQAYAEANAGFLVCTGDGRLLVKSLSQHSNYPTTKKKPVDEIIPSYRDLSFEEYTVQQIRWLTSQYQNNKTYAYGVDKEHSWYKMENVIFRMSSNISHFIESYRTPRNYLFDDLLTFRPYKADVFGRWWLEPGDRVQITTGCDDIPTVDSFVLSRKIKGINGMSVIIEAKGKEYLGQKEGEDNNAN